jgi:hypothetical protein
VWEDYRDGAWYVYGQRYDISGNALGDNFVVNDDFLGGSHYTPRVAMAPSGSFVVAWYDYRDENANIYAQRYDGSGVPQGANFKVNDDAGVEPQYDPSVVVDGLGKFTVVWEDRRDGNYDVYAQRYTAAGVAQGANFKVNDDPGTADQRDPWVAVDETGNFAVVWEDYRDSNWNIYGQRYNSSGAPQGANFKVNDDAGTASQYDARVGMDVTGKFVVVWEDYRDGNYNIYAQRYNASGVAQGVNFLVNDDGGSTSQTDPGVGMASDGRFVIVWEDERAGGGNDDIYGQRYDALGVAQGVNFLVSDDVGSGDQYDPGIGMVGGGEFLVAWHDLRLGPPMAYGQRYDALGTAQGVNFPCNADEGSGDQWFARVAVRGDGGVVALWSDERGLSEDIYAQRYDADGNELGSNLLVNDDGSDTYQGWPDVGVKSDGAFVGVWEDWRNATDCDIYGQRYDANGLPQGSNFRVNGDASGQNQYYASVGVAEDGRFVVAWFDYRSGTDWDIYVQRYSSAGVGQGANLLVNDDASGEDQCDGDLAVDAGGNFVVVWQDYRSGTNWDIYARRFNAAGIPQGASFLVNDDPAGSFHDNPQVAMDASGNFVVVWVDQRNPDLDIYGQRYDAAGNPLGANFRIVDDLWGYWQGDFPRLACAPGGDFVVIWTDERNGDTDLYGQRYHADGNAWGENMPLALDVGLNPDQWAGGVAATDTQVVFGWRDARRSRGWDMWAKIVTWDWEGVGIGEGPGVKGPGVRSSLGQNAPNPFCGGTMISLSLSQEEWVTLLVYDVTGRRVVTLADGRLPAGSHQVVWDGRGSEGRPVSAGVYLYRLEAGSYAETRRMAVVR